jgi:hypothetical protein
LKNIFGPKKEQVTRGLRKLHNEGLCDFTAHSGDQIKKDETGRACGTYEAHNKCKKSLWGNLKKKECLEGVDIDRVIMNLK